MHSIPDSYRDFEGCETSIVAVTKPQPAAVATWPLKNCLDCNESPKELACKQLLSVMKY
ncbi:MAG: hypothetical protein JWR61_3738 [Ferruginibacter sp.]|nr:hypothetical protein [Ferruginibacter sp.]